MNHFIRCIFNTVAVLTCVSLSFVSASAQVDTEFWFVAPEVWANHGDSPTLLRFATFDQDAVVTVEQPANPGFPTQTLNIGAVDGTYYFVLRINRSEGDLSIVTENGSVTYTEEGAIELTGNLTLVR